MKPVFRSFLVLLCILLSYANVVAQTQASPDDILILKTGMSLPEGAKRIGEIKVVDGGFKINCGYDRTIDEAKAKARKKGGNIVKITELKAPDMWSTCYRLWAEVYYTDSLASYSVSQSNKADSILNEILPDTASYALLCAYRPKNGIGVLVQYNLHVEDTTVARVKNGSKHVVRLYKPGKTKIWARTEAREEVNLDVQHGKVYFLKCTVGMGVMVGQPRLDLVSAEEGLNTFGEVKIDELAVEVEKKQDGDDIYK